MNADYQDGDMGNMIYGEEPEIKPTRTRQVVHDSVEEVHSDLTTKQRAKVVKGLAHHLQHFQSVALSCYRVREYLYRLFNSKTNDELAVSALSRDFNMSIHGHNQELGKRVTRLFKEACDADNRRFHFQAFSLLVEAKIRYELLLSKEVVCILFSLGENLEDVTEISRCREKLFASVTKMVSDLALKRHRGLMGEVIEDVDLIQEALALAMEAINRYKPDFTDGTDAGKTFTDYIYRTVSGNLSHFVVDSSRNVRVPRSAIDRSRPVYYALDKLGNVSYDKLADEATRILADLRLKNARRKLIQNERYSAEEVYDILAHTQNEASMDAVISTDEFGHENTFGEMIPATFPTADRVVDVTTGQAKLITVIQDYCDTDEEREVLNVRWGSEKTRGLKITADHYREHNGRSMNKTKVAEIENRVFAKIREAILNGTEVRVTEVAEALSE